MSTFKLNKVDTLPEISRAGRKSEELNMIIAALNESVNDGNPFRIDGIEAGNAYNSMQQRIRAQAKKLGYNIVIRFDAIEGSLFFKATNTTTPTTTVPSNEVTGVKTKAKTNTSK